MRRADLVGHLNTFLHRQLTGRRVIDPSNASFTGLYETVKQGGWSDELCRICGIERTQFDGTHEAFLNCIIPDDRPKVLQVNAEATASGTAFEVEYRIQTRAGDLKTIREIGCGIKDASGKVIGLFGTAQDITEYKRAEESLFASEQRLNSFFTSAPAGLALLDQQLRFVQINETVVQINGVSMKDHLGKTVREVLPKLASVAEPLLQQVLATGEPLLNIELSGETPSQPGVLRHWMESLFPVFGKDGRTNGVGVIFVERLCSQLRHAEVGHGFQRLWPDGRFGRIAMAQRRGGQRQVPFRL